MCFPIKDYRHVQETGEKVNVLLKCKIQYFISVNNSCISDPLTHKTMFETCFVVGTMKDVLLIQIAYRVVGHVFDKVSTLDFDEFL